MIAPGSGVADGMEKSGTPEFWRSRRVLVTGGAGFLGSHGRPVGVQLVGKVFDDEKLLRIAHWCHQILTA